MPTKVEFEEEMDTNCESDDESIYKLVELHSNDSNVISQF